LKSPQLSDADIARGKAMLKGEISYVADNDAAALENMAQQLLFKEGLCKTSDLVAQVDKITPSEVKSVHYLYKSNFQYHSIIPFMPT